MKTEYRLSEALKEMMERTPLDEISVVSLTKKCNVNRQTFYYHFHDIYDLLTLVFLNEKIRNIDKAKKLNEMVVAIYQYYEENTLFIEAALNSAGKELFQEFIYNNCFQVILRFVNEAPNNKRLLTEKYKFKFGSLQESLNGLFKNSKIITSIKAESLKSNNLTFAQQTVLFDINVPLL